MLMTDGALSVGSRTLEVQRLDAPAGRPTIVFLHEGLGSVEQWRDFPVALAQRCGYGAVMYSRYGNGRSEILREKRVPGYMHHEALAVLPELLRLLDIERPVLFGHSDGASIALIHAGVFPGRVAALVLEAPHVIVESCSLASIAAIGEHYRTGGLREKMARYHLDVDRTFFGWNDIWLDRDFAGWDIRDAVREITAPALVIQGADDEYGTLRQLDLLAANSRAPADRLVLARCGHAPHRDRRAAVEDATQRWLGDNLQ